MSESFTRLQHLDASGNALLLGADILRDITCMTVTFKLSRVLRRQDSVTTLINTKQRQLAFQKHSRSVPPPPVTFTPPNPIHPRHRSYCPFRQPSSEVFKTALNRRITLEQPLNNPRTIGGKEERKRWTLKVRRRHASDNRLRKGQRTQRCGVGWRDLGSKASRHRSRVRSVAF
jgi:hypothetical protein